MSRDDDGGSFPRCMRQREVLDVAVEHPDASIHELAAEVPSATPDLVLLELDEDGVPASQTGDEARAAGRGDADIADVAVPESEDSAEAEGDETDAPSGGVEIGHLSENRRWLLEVVTARPQASLSDLESRIAALERSNLADEPGTRAFEDPELLHKVAHGCLESEAEERPIVKALLR